VIIRPFARNPSLCDFGRSRTVAISFLVLGEAGVPTKMFVNALSILALLQAREEVKLPFQVPEKLHLGYKNPRQMSEGGTERRSTNNEFIKARMLALLRERLHPTAYEKGPDRYNYQRSHRALLHGTDPRKQSEPEMPPQPERQDLCPLF
jgi:hypothetical protein